MSALSPATRTKLARCLALLSSDHPGERDAAGLAADRIVRGAGLSWDQLLELKQPEQLTEPGFSRRAPRGPMRIDDIYLCRRHVDRLNSWEREFVGSIAGRASVTEAQKAKLQQIAATLRTRGFA